MSPDEQQIRQLIQDWMQATREGATERVLDFMTDDVVFLRAGHPPMDKAAFAAAARAQAHGDAPRFDGRSEVQEVQVAGDWAWVRTWLQVDATPPGGGTLQRRSGHTLSIFRRDAGRWRLARDANLLAPDASNQ